jgi:hypothetical protein
MIPVFGREDFFYAGLQFPRLEWFGHDCIGIGCQQLVKKIFMPGKHENVDAAEAPDPPDHFKAADVGKPEIQDDNRRKYLRNRAY